MVPKIGENILLKQNNKGISEYSDPMTRKQAKQVAKNSKNI